MCRQRRVKCDERKVCVPFHSQANPQPRCSNCSRHPNRVCEYPFVAAEGVLREGGEAEPEADGDGYLYGYGDGGPEEELTIVRSSSSSTIVGDEPYIPVAYRDLLLAHATAALMEAQRVDADLLK